MKQIFGYPNRDSESRSIFTHNGFTYELKSEYGVFPSGFEYSMFSGGSCDKDDNLYMICRDPEAKAGEGQECSLWFDPDSHALLRGELSQDGFTVIQCVFSGFATME